MATDNLMPQSSTSIIKHFMLRSSTTGQGLTGKVHSDFSGKYNIAGGAEVTLSFSSGTAGDAYSSGKIAPLGLGKYAWHVPNAVFASLGNVSAVLSVTGGIDVHCEWLVVADSRDLSTKPVNLTQIGGVAQSATDLKDFVDTGYDPATHKVAGVVLVDTTTTNTDMRGTNNASLASGVILATSQPNYAPAKAGDEMAVTSTARGLIAAACDLAIINQGDGADLIGLLADAIAADWVAGDASPLAIADAVWTRGTRTITGGALTASPPTTAEILTALGTGSWATSLAQSSVWTPTIAGRIDVATSTRLAPTVSGRTFNVSATGEGAVELNTATQTQLDDIETAVDANTGYLTALTTNMTTLLGRVTSQVYTMWTDLIAMITGSGSTPKFTTSALSNAPTGSGGSGGGNAPTIVTLQAVAGISPGVIVGPTEPLVIGDDYLTVMNRSIRINLLDENGDPAEVDYGTYALDDSGISIYLLLARSGKPSVEAQIFGTCTFFPAEEVDSVLIPPYLIVEFTKAETAKAVPGAYDMQAEAVWQDGKVVTFAPYGQIQFVRDIRRA